MTSVFFASHFGWGFISVWINHIDNIVLNFIGSIIYISYFCSTTTALQEIWISVQSVFWTWESACPGWVQNSERGSGEPCRWVRRQTHYPSFSYAQQTSRYAAGIEPLTCPDQVSRGGRVAQNTQFQGGWRGVTFYSKFNHGSARCTFCNDNFYYRDFCWL